MLAKIQQSIQDKTKHTGSRFHQPFKQASTTSAKYDQPKSASPLQLTKERQLRDYCRTNNMCFYCREPYDATHAAKCTKRPKNQVNALVLNDLDITLTDEVLKQLDMEDALAEEFCTLSLNALAGTEHGEAMKLRSLVKNKVFLLLVDSGSSHSFVSSTFLQRVGIVPVPAPPKQVRVANGDILISDKCVPDLAWWIQGHSFVTYMRVLDMPAYDAILGFDWLSAHSPITHHWDTKTMSFDHKGVSVTLQGVQTSHKTLEELPVDRLQKWMVGNDVWALAVVDVFPSEPAPEAIPDKVQQLLTEYQDVFAEPKGLPPERQYDHAIPILPHAIPVNCKPYRYSPLHKDEIERQVRELLAAGLITTSTSPYASPVLLVQKKDGSWRFCVDYRRLNDITIKNRFPMPLVDEILDELAGTSYFSKLDMRSGYHQVRMKKGEEPKTAFKTHHGHFEFRVMPFGLTNAPATFQCIMNDILSPFLRKFVLVFLDDILVYSPTLQDHVIHLEKVLSKLREHKLYMKRSKCSFAQHQLEYLGHIISDQGVSTDPAKTAAMMQWPIPTTVTEVRGFLGLTGYYRKFVKHYGLIAKPLTQLLKKKQFCWSPDAQQAFDNLKQAMSTTPVLTLPDFNVPFVVETDASEIGVGAVLMQRDQPVAFLSKALGPAHQKLFIYEKEFLALIMAVEKWRPYL